MMNISMTNNVRINKGMYGTVHIITIITNMCF